MRTCVRGHTPPVSVHGHVVSQNCPPNCYCFLGKAGVFLTSWNCTFHSVETAEWQALVCCELHRNSKRYTMIFSPQLSINNNLIVISSVTQMRSKAAKRLRFRPRKSWSNWWFNPLPASPVTAGGSPARLEDPCHRSRRGAGPDSSHNQNTSATIPKTQEKKRQQWAKNHSWRLANSPSCKLNNAHRDPALKHWW